MKKLLFIYNPHSGKGRIKAKLSDIIDSFVIAGYEVTIYTTQGVQDATRIVVQKCSEEEFDVVACSGGDGTLNEIVSGVMQLNKRPKVGYIPSGTTNDFATSLKIPKDMGKAAETIANPEVFACDIGSINQERYFNYVVGFGAFTEVSYETSQAAKNMLGRMAYILEGAKRVTSLKSYHMTVTHDGETVEDDFIYGMISNSESIGGFKLLGNRKITLDDGLFEVFLIRMPKNLIELQLILNSLISENPNDKFIYTCSTDKVSMHADEPISVAIDGEAGGSFTDMELVNCKKAVEFLVPKEQAAELML